MRESPSVTHGSGLRGFCFARARACATAWSVNESPGVAGILARICSGFPTALGACATAGFADTASNRLTSKAPASATPRQTTTNPIRNALVDVGDVLINLLQRLKRRAPSGCAPSQFRKY